jgi:hypothetical protein
MAAVDHSPGAVSVQTAVVVALLAVLTVYPGGLLAVGVALAGGSTLAVGSIRGSRAPVSAGAALLFGGVLFGAGGTPDPLYALLGGALAVVAWDVAEFGIGVGEQLGRDAPTARLEVTHAAASAIVGLLAVAAGYGVYVVAWSGLPTVALVCLLAAALLLTLTLALRE